MWPLLVVRRMLKTDQVAYIEVKRIRKGAPASREIEFTDDLRVSPQCRVILTKRTSPAGHGWRVSVGPSVTNLGQFLLLSEV